jgi:hypothetical protein
MALFTRKTRIGSRTPSLVCALLLGVAGCNSPPSRSVRNDSGTDGTRDAPQTSDGKSNVGDVPACVPLFHACGANSDCCAPNRCLNITGTLECQQEGPAGGD